MLRSVAASVPRCGPRGVRARPVGGGRPGRHRGDRHPVRHHRQLATRDRRPAPAGLVLVDEASMVPTLTLKELTRAANARGCRVGLVGDYAQMGSPKAGGLSATSLSSRRPAG